MKKLTIAIDGHSSCGKSTVAKELAKQLNYIYIDTGAMYRAVTLYAIKNHLIENGEVKHSELINQLSNIDISFRYNPQNQTAETCLNQVVVEDEIRSMQVSDFVSPVSTIKEVREKMVSLQQLMGKNGGVVLDGRDIGTVVFPQADVKLFMTASPQVRAQRRFDELSQKGQMVTYTEILNNLQTRDRIDQSRKESPLRKAEDAETLDNSHLSRQAQIDWVMQLIYSRFSDNDLHTIIENKY